MKKTLTLLLISTLFLSACNDKIANQNQEIKETETFEELQDESSKFKRPKK